MNLASTEHKTEAVHIQTRHMRGSFSGQPASYTITLLSDAHGYVAVAHLIHDGQPTLAQLGVTSSEIHHRPFYQDRASFRSTFLSDIQDAVRRGDAALVASVSPYSAVSSIDARPPLAYCRVNPHSLPKTFSGFTTDDLGDWVQEVTSNSISHLHQ